MDSRARGDSTSGGRLPDRTSASRKHVCSRRRFVVSRPRVALRRRRRNLSRVVTENGISNPKPVSRGRRRSVRRSVDPSRKHVNTKTSRELSLSRLASRVPSSASRAVRAYPRAPLVSSALVTARASVVRSRRAMRRRSNDRVIEGRKVARNDRRSLDGVRFDSTTDANARVR